MRLLIYFIGLVLFLSANSCNKVLDMAPDGKISLADVFSDPTSVEAFLNSCYENLPRKGTRYSCCYTRNPVVWSDDAWDVWAATEPWIGSGDLYNGNVSAASHPGHRDQLVEYWPAYWSSIRNCSIFIAEIDNASVNSEEARQRMRAEAHLLRAFYYMELLKWFGSGLPIIEEPLNFTDDLSGLSRASYYDVVQFILKDCDVALATSELPWRITTEQENGRVTKALAEAIKSRMILFAASPLYNDGESRWEQAYQINKASVENLRAQGYELYRQVNFPQTYLSEDAFFSGPEGSAQFSALYNEYFTQVMRYAPNPTDKETIFQSSVSDIYVHWTDGIGAQNQLKSGSCPTQELVDAYETINGMPILDLNNPYLDEKHLEPNYNKENTLYNPNDPYKNRDPRFYASIYYNGSKRKAQWNFAESPQSPENYPAPAGSRTRIITTYVGEPQTGLNESSSKMTATGYYYRKFLHPFSGFDIDIWGANFKHFRFGEILLNFAEAAAEAGYLQEAVGAVNEIRNRVNMPNLPASLTKNELILRIKNERRIELAFEEHRYFDIRRWTLPNGDLAKTDKWITAAEIHRKSDGTYTYGRKTVRAVERKNYTNRFLWVPIPLNEANRLQSVTGVNWQAPGW